MLLVARVRPNVVRARRPGDDAGAIAYARRRGGRWLAVAVRGVGRDRRERTGGRDSGRGGTASGRVSGLREP